MKTTAISDKEMRRINTGEINVAVLQATADEARKLMDEVEDEDLQNAIDEVQGDVFSGQADVAYLIIKITNKA